ncbi:hypothetical protein ACF07V_06125 [Streptomyces sp. NPDC015661]|uniref:hypothetical protein n=1 Tax=Streptomyces sp. NPDC015661 TaxID=3364961 RepID=UPI0036FAD594
MARASVEVLSWWAALLLFQVLLIGSVNWPELAVAAGGALLAALAARAVRVAAGARLGGTAGWARALLLWPGALLTDTWRLGRAVVRTLRGHRVVGRFVTIRWRPGTGGAWAGGLLSATPGVYVVDQGPGRTALVHSLPGGAGSLETALTTGDRT